MAYSLGMKLNRHWIPVWGFALLIFAVSSIPGLTVSVPVKEDFIFADTFHNPSKIGHLIEFGIFGWLCLRALTWGNRFPLGKAACLAFLIAAAYGASDEWHQYFVPNRICGLDDWVADCIGSLLTILIFILFYSKKLSSDGQIDNRPVNPV